MISAPDTRTQQIDEIVRDLIPCVAQLTRLVLKHARADISRSEGAILRTLVDGPKRITELAELEGLAQPTTTTLIKRLEANGWVVREHDPVDGRAVLVSLTPDGSTALVRYRAQYRAVLRDRVAAMPDQQIEALGNALGALEALLVAVQQGRQP